MFNKTIFLSAITSIFFLIGCGGGNTENTEAAQNTTSEAATKDDGQGVGKFKNITLAAIDTKLAEQGKAIFESKCSACHKTTDQKVVGPGLKGITLKQSPAWILNMITNPEEMTKKDPTAKKLLEEHLTQMTFQDVSDDDAKKILDYLRQNDEGGAETAAK